MSRRGRGGAAVSSLLGLVYAVNRLPSIFPTLPVLLRRAEIPKQ